MESLAEKVQSKVTPVVVFIAFYAAALVLLYKCGFWLLGIVAAAAGGLALLSLFLPKRGRLFVTVALTAVLAGCGRAALNRAMYIEPVEQLIGQTFQITAELQEIPEKNDYGYLLELKLRSAENESGRYEIPAKFICYGGDVIPEMKIGDTLSFEAKVYAARDSGKYSGSNGYLFRVFLNDQELPTVTEDTGFSLYRTIAAVREYCTGTIDRMVSGEEGALAKGVLLGDKSSFTDGMYQMFRRTGMSHAVAVSGMHISIFVGILMFLLDLLGVHRKISAVIGCIAAILFTALTGFSPSAMRACIMAVILYLGRVVHRERDSLNSLFIALFLILTVTPYLSFSLSLWLSFFATLGILLLSTPLARLLMRPFSKLQHMKKPVQFLCESLSVSFSAVLFLLPLSAVFFGETSLLGPLAMLLCGAAITLLFGAGFLLVIVGAVPVLGSVVAFLVKLCASYILWVLRLLMKFPYALVPLDYGYLVFVAVSALLMIGLYFLFRERIRVRLWPVVVCVLLLVPACGVSTMQFQVRAGYGERALFTSIDVGQGDCTAIISGDRAVLFDGGSLNYRSADDMIEKYLTKNGVYRIEAIFLTHFHEDHTSAVTGLIDRFEVGEIYFPDMQSEERAAIEEAAGKRNVQIVPVAQNQTVEPIENLKIELICDHFDVSHADDENENSMLALADFKGSSLLVTGDLTARGERDLIKKGEELDCDVLKVAHHGSKTSSSGGFLRESSPLAALISVGQNSFGHPSAETLERIGDYTSFIFRTDELGTVELYTEGNSEFIRLKG